MSGKRSAPTGICASGRDPLAVSRETASGSHQTITPTHGASVSIRHDTVELSFRALEDQRQEMTIAFPQRQLQHALHLDPYEVALGVAGIGFALEVIDAEKEAEPILAVFAETGPADGPAQHQRLALQPALLADLATKTCNHILAWLDLAAQPVVLAEMRIIAAAITVNQQHAPAVRREDVTQRGENGSIRHADNPPLAREMVRIQIHFLHNI